MYNEVNKIVTYIQPDKYKCQLHVSPRVLRLLGIVTENEWITATVLHSIHKPSIDKFLQTMWIYSNIIQPQFVGDTLAHLLRIIPVLPDKDTALVTPNLEPLVWCKLAQNYIPTVDILITNSLGELPVKFDDDEVIIGLLFRHCLQSI